MNHQAGARRLQVPSHMVNVHGDRVGIRLLVNAVKFLLQDGFGHDTPEPAHHLLEDRELAA